ncbi:hypothetical protein FDZ71_00510 [bacterium]|nr:MAG: hypothetical protein FDZ71_00510 [bacterium]
MTLTIPAGWEATLTAYSTPDGDLRATENLVVENLDATSGPKALMVFSSSAATLSPESINDYGHDEFVSVGNIDGAELLVGTPERGFSPKRLMAAQTRIPRAQLGLLYFAGDPADPATAFRDVCRLFAVSGL